MFSFKPTCLHTSSFRPDKQNKPFSFKSTFRLFRIQGQILNKSHLRAHNASRRSLLLLFLCADTPSQRVQFILGTEDDDLEHVPHDLFTELDELSFRDGSATEWKETARSGSSLKGRLYYNKQKVKGAQNSTFYQYSLSGS